MDVAEWLQTLGCERYEAAFLENDVSADLLHSLTEQDLKDLGVTSVGHRRRMLEAIARLRADGAAAPEAPDAGPSPGAVAPASVGQSLEQVAERRQVSVMFCDLIGSTSLAARTEPEDLGELLRDYQSRVRTAVGQFGGHIACYVGDGVLIYFGWPESREADAERAVRAGLAVAAAVNETPVRGENLEVRVGIATGLVVIGAPIGSGDSRQQTAVGETPNLAARLQSFAGPGNVVIDAATRRQIGGLFDCRELGPRQMKGFANPVLVWTVVGESAVEGRFAAFHPNTLAPLIGRDDELRLLVRRWHQAKAGEGQIVLITGEPGIGKSRLIAELEDRLRSEQHVGLRYFCSPHHQDSALYPVIARWERELGFARGDTPEDKLRKFEALLEPTGTSVEDMALIADLLGIPSDGRYAPLMFSPQQKKTKTLEALARHLINRTQEQPVLMLFEDAHWADQSSLELLDNVVGLLTDLPILLVTSFRTEFAAPWIGHAGVSLISLSRLTSGQAGQLAAQVTIEKVLPPPLIARIIAQADGVPLFIEELTKSVLESAEQPGRPAVVPATLQASLMARLDRLPAAKQVAQIGAVIGREFPYRLLAAAAKLPETELDRGLDQLVASGLAHRRGTPPDALYTFKHALVQEAAYDSLLRGRRTQMHAAIVDVLESDPGSDGSQTALLAYHSERAGLVKKAVTYLLRAGGQSAQRAAVVEARAYFMRGLTLAARLPDVADRGLRQVELQLALGNAQMALHGFGSPEHAATLGEAVARCRGLNPEAAEQRALIARALWGEWTRKVHVGELETSLDIARELLELGQRAIDPELCALAATSLGASCIALGRFEESLAKFATAPEQFELSNHRATAPDFGIDVEVVFHTLYSRALACRGYLEQAANQSSLGLKRARMLKHLPSIAIALGSSCTTLWLLRSSHRLEQYASELLSLSGQLGFGFWLARGKAYSGWVSGTKEAYEEGRNRLTEAREALRAAGITMYGSEYCIMLAQVLAWAGHDTLALDVLREGFAISSRTGEIWLDSELHRTKGEVLQADPVAAEGEFREAINIAQKQTAKLLELRAVMSLARLWSAQDRRAEARNLLTPIYDWFTEGLDMTDLQEARELARSLNDSR